MAEYAADLIEKVHTPPLVQDCTHPDETDDDDGAEGALVALSGPPVDGGVPTYDAGTQKHTSQVPGSPAADVSVWMPLTTVVGGEPVLVWDGSDQLIPTLTPI